MLQTGKRSITGFKIKSVAAYQIMREGMTVQDAVKWVDTNKPAWNAEKISVPKRIIAEWERLR